MSSPPDPSTPGAAPAGRLAGMLAEDVAALLFVRFPQFPSSRVPGDAPAATPWEVHARVPTEPGAAQIVPVPPRPFPASLRDPDLLPARLSRSDWVAMFWGALSVIGIPIFLYRRWKARRRDAAQAGANLP